MKNENLESTEDFIIKNWDLVSEETQKMLKLVGVSPNGNK